MFQRVSWQLTKHRPNLLKPQSFLSMRRSPEALTDMLSVRALNSRQLVNEVSVRCSLYFRVVRQHEGARGRTVERLNSATVTAQ
jgi:hypothetical protein